MLFTVLSARRTAASLAAGLAELGRPQQDLALHWVHVAAQNTGELGYQVASAVDLKTWFLFPDVTESGNIRRFGGGFGVAFRIGE